MRVGVNFPPEILFCYKKINVQSQTCGCELSRWIKCAAAQFSVSTPVAVKRYIIPRNCPRSLTFFVLLFSRLLARRTPRIADWSPEGGKQTLIVWLKSLIPVKQQVESCRDQGKVRLRNKQAEHRISLWNRKSRGQIDHRRVEAKNEILEKPIMHAAPHPG